VRFFSPDRTTRQVSLVELDLMEVRVPKSSTSQFSDRFFTTLPLVVSLTIVLEQRSSYIFGRCPTNKYNKVWCFKLIARNTIIKFLLCIFLWKMSITTTKILLTNNHTYTHLVYIWNISHCIIWSEYVYT